MTKLDINGNTVSRNRNYLVRVLGNMTSPEIEIDSVGRVMVKTGDGGMIVFFEEEERRVFNGLVSRLNMNIRPV